MKCHILFSGKSKKNIPKSRLLKILPRVLSVKPIFCTHAVICSSYRYEEWNFYCLCRRMMYLFVLRFYGPVNPMGSCRARSIYLTTRLLGRLSPLSGLPVLCTFFRQKLTTALLELAEGRK